ncbi:MAG: hypothetical protein DHS20C11_21220 [Lysobacteraceae bacterium]|nr:MAG: hypothetical protein DHS20C11_21220 [Xanthomonadaceae bacterium]
MFKRQLLVCVALAIAMGIGERANADNCSALAVARPAFYGGAQLSYWIWNFSGAQAPVVMGVAQGNGCVGCNLVAMTMYDFACVNYASNLASFAFRSTSPSVNNTMNICSVMTAMGGGCEIRGGDGLPIELMDYTIE